MAQITETRALIIFLDSIKTDSTKANYVYWLNRYLEWKKAENHDELLKDGQDKIQTDIEDYVMKMKSDHKSKSTIKISLYALFHFFMMNRIILNEKLIKKLLPEEDSKKRQAYSNEDVKAILSAIEVSKIKKHKRWVFRKPRARAIIHFFASTGVRLGSIPDMKFGDIEKFQDDCYCVKVYANTRYEYLTFLTPEASFFLDEYLATRDDLTKDSSLFQMSYPAIRKLITRLVIKAKITPVTTKTQKDYFSEQSSTRLFLDIPVVHGFRSRWNTIMKSNNTINKSMIESMMGHQSSIALDESYFRPTRENLFAEFKKGIQALTIF